ncbi:uncharacterized protein KGF55_003928 [Candida pseudojiufengensis]|uniref:uncharacterized protein n=1 Tax=Candida pseudojiufengensis TaxID=497109 RepID=UPI0022249BA0|nr:uncharacterized protein KGF55_003928 [Candida pseudojiufengensis]KAI5961611.1 hypothetical protein KGF55_003928 [Candida pseudojiufengensis]
MNYQFNIFYIEIILSIIFIVSIILIGLNLKIQTTNTTELETEKLNTIELKNLKSTSDILKIETNPLCEIVVSFEIDHTITAWSPITKEKHVLTNQIWPVNHISISDDGNEIILINFNKQIIYCFQNFKLKWTKSYNEFGRTTKILESFFRKKTVAGYLTRKMMSDNHKSGNFPAPPSPILGPSTLVAKKRIPEQKESNNEYIIILETGQILTISCQDGSISVIKFPNLSAATKLKTPRVNDKIIFKKQQNGELITGTLVNNKFIFKDLTLKFKNQIPPPSQKFLNTPVLIPLDFLGMIVSVQDFTASLIDVQTGIVLKTFNIGYYKTGTFKVAHSEPTHCKFCGCVSINSLSLIYKDESGILIIQTYKIESQRSKNSICLRVERDIREIRCLGFNAISESQYWYENLKCWQVTDVNMIIGFEKIKDNNNTKQPLKLPSTPQQHGLQSLRQRNSPKPKPNQEKYEGFIISLTDGKKDNYPLTNLSSSSSSLKIISTSKYGYKSILVNFGEFFKIYYQGHNKLIENNLYYNNDAGNSLLFINKRRNRT